MDKWKNRKGFFENGRKLNILGVKANDGGCAQYRLIQPLNKLQELYPDVVNVKIVTNPLDIDTKTQKQIPDFDFADFKWADVVMTNNLSNFGGPFTSRICGIAKEYNCLFHFDTDDLLTNLYDGHRLKGVYEEKNLSEITAWIYSKADLVTVTQRKFFSHIKHHVNRCLVVVKNAIDYTLPSWDGHKVPHQKKNFTRIGWVAGIHHTEDIKEFSGIPQMVNGRVGRENIHWGFYGRPTLAPGQEPDWQQETWENYQKLILRGFRGGKNWAVYNALPIHLYGNMYKGIDISIAPLQDNQFNQSKSEIKIAECYGENTKILMLDGSYKKVQDIEVNDKLMGADSKVRTVINTVTGKDKMFEIVPKRGKAFVVNSNHILPLFDPKTKANLDISVSDYFNLTSTQQKTFKLRRAEVKFKEQALPLDPYFIGIMLGDGSFLKTPRITTMDGEIKEFFSSYTLQFDPSLHINIYTNKGSKASTISASNEINKGPIKNSIIEEFKKLGLYKISCKDKFIPDIYKFSSYEQRLKLLAGLIDTDGTLSKKGLYSFSNTSLPLIKDVEYVARSLGFYVGKIVKQYKGKNYWYRVTISTGESIIPCLLPRKIKTYNSKTNRDHKTSTFSITPKKEDYYYGFTLKEDPYHLLEDFTIGHNCGRYATPLVSSNVGCYDEIIENGKTGYLIDPDAPKTEWVKRLSYLAKNPKKRIEMGENLKAITDEYFDLNKVVYKRLDVYEQTFKALAEKEDIVIKNEV